MFAGGGPRSSHLVAWQRIFVFAAVASIALSSFAVQIGGNIPVPADSARSSHASQSTTTGSIDKPVPVSPATVRTNHHAAAPLDSLSVSVAANQTEGKSPLRVALTGSASGGTPPYTYLWDYGDGSPNSTGRNTTHTYFATEGGAVPCGATFPPPPGPSTSCFPATLIVTDALGYANTSSVFLLVIPSVLNVSIAENRTSGASPLGVGLTATASGGAPPYRFLWDFGDGSSNSSGPTATHTYRNGTFVTTVLVFDKNGDSATSNVTVSATGGAATFAAIASSVLVGTYLPLRVNFTSTETGCARTPSYLWDFGDGQVGSGRNVTHTYDVAGNFVATVLISCPEQGVSEATSNVSAAWSGLGWGLFSDTYAYAPFNATIGCTPFAGVPPFGCIIDFGDGSPAVRGVVTFHHIFWFAGNFPVTLTLSDALGRNATGTIGMTVLRAPLYNVTFTETGLPPGTRWFVSIPYSLNLSSSGPSIQMNLYNSSLNFPSSSYNFSAGSSDRDLHALPGSFWVNGTSVLVNVSFLPETFLVRFNQTGLPNGTAWWVNVSGEPSRKSIGPPIALALPNGTYSYSVSTADKTYRSGGGSLDVTGNGLNVSVEFWKVTYRVELVENGLPVGISWGILFGPSGASLVFAPTFNSTMSFAVANGTYAFQVVSPHNYTPVPANGIISVSGANVTEPIDFSGPLSSSWSVPPWTYSLFVGAVGVAVFAVAAIVSHRRYAKTASRETKPPS
jgi:PKD repeat protein